MGRNPTHRLTVMFRVSTLKWLSVTLQVGDGGMARLEIRSPSPLAGQVCEIRGAELVVGRSPDADWPLKDPHLSRHHAVIRPGAAFDEVEDLRSTSGTWVNDRRISGRHRLRHGDVVRMATVEMQYVAEAHAAARFDITSQHAGTINNVGRDQYFQQIVIAREDAYRRLEPMNRFVTVLFSLGFGLAGLGVVGFIGSGAAGAITNDGELIVVAGVPLIAIAMGVALIGFVLCIFAMVFSGLVSRKRKHIDERYPLAPFPTR
jgi:hypothetical protein